MFPLALPPLLSMRRCASAGQKAPAYNAVPLREQQLAQYQMGKAKARVEAARDMLYRAAKMAYDDVASSGTWLSLEAKIRLQLALSFAAETCAEAVRYVNDAIPRSAWKIASSATSVISMC